MKKHLIALLLAACSTAYSTEEWIELASSETHLIEGLAGSLVNNGTVATMSGRVKNKQTSAVVFERWYVKKDQCAQGFGILVTSDMESTKLRQDGYIIEGNTIGSTLAKIACSSFSPPTKRGNNEV